MRKRCEVVVTVGGTTIIAIRYNKGENEMGGGDLLPRASEYGSMPCRRFIGRSGGTHSAGSIHRLFARFFVFIGQIIILLRPSARRKYTVSGMTGRRRTNCFKIFVMK